MISIFDKSNPINLTELFNAVKRGEDILIRTYSYDEEFDYIIERVVEKILARYGLEVIKNALAFCIRELTGNSRKAIVKRIFFTEHELSVSNEQDYRKGMNLFHKTIYNDIDIYNDRMKDEGYFISFHVIHNANSIVIKVESNTELTYIEKERITNKLNKVKGMKDLGSQLDSIIDTTEGAGLGLIMISMMLQKEGINPDGFTIQATDDQKTASKIIIEKSKMVETPFSIISRTLIKEIETLPQFPENVRRIIQIINDEKATLVEIARIILQDVAMAADLLKLANSAFFMLPKRVRSIEEALKIVGLKGLKNLVYSYGTISAISEKYGRYGKLEEIWSHSNRVSYYAVELARGRKLRDIAEDAAVGGLLHDLGKIIISTLQPDIIQKIKKIVLAKNNIPEHMVEELIVGINHAKLGSMMAEHWNFPDHLIKSIEYHHVPGFADIELAPLVYTVYFANALTDIERGIINYRNINREVLEFFNLFDMDDLKELHQSLKSKLELRISDHKNFDDK